MSFANPIWLYGLLGLAIPIMIHLWSKKEGKTIKVGSIRFFPESETRQSRRLSPNELLLLLLRCLVLIFLVMLIAQPILIGKKKQERATVLIDPLVIDDASVLAMIDSISQEDYNIKLLQAGLPDYDSDDEQVGKTMPYWNAIPAIEQLPSNEVLIFARNQASAFKGRLPFSSKQISWYHIPPRESGEKVIKATLNQGQVRVSIAHFDEASTLVEHLVFKQGEPAGVLDIQGSGDQIQFKTKTQDAWVPVEKLEPIHVQLRYSQDYEMDKRLWEAAINALWKTNGIPIEGISSLHEDVENGLEIRVYLESGEVLLFVRTDELFTDLLKESPEGYHITRRLSLENITSENVAEELATKVFKDNKVEGELAKYDQRVLSTNMVEPAFSTIKGNVGKQNQAIPYIYWVLLMGLVGLERIVSFQKKQ